MTTMLSHVRCIAFDAVGTLIYPDPPVAEVYARVGGKHGSRLSKPEVQARFREAFRMNHDRPRVAREPDDRSIWREIVRRAFPDIDNIDACFEELYAHFGQASAWRCFSDVQETLEELSRREFVLLLASNFDNRLRAICEGHAELGGISAQVISAEIGANKPTSSFYRTLLDKAGYQRQELLMVGDDWNNDVNGAREFGIKAIHLDRSRTNADSMRDNVTVISSLTELLELLP